MHGHRDIRDFRSHSKSSENLSSVFVFPQRHDENVLTIPIPVQRGLHAARSAENLTSQQHNRPLPTTPNHTPRSTPHHHAPGTPPKPPPRFNSPRPSISSIDEDWAGSSRLLVNRPSPRPSVTSLDVVTLGSTDCLGDDIDVYVKSQRQLTIGVILLAGLVLILLALVSLILVWSVAQEVPKNKMVAAHVLINTAGLKEEKAKLQVAPQRSNPKKRLSSCELGYELMPWMVNIGTTTLKGIIFNPTTNRLIIADTGYYFVYSQVVFDKVGDKVGHDIFSDSLFHVMCKSSPETGKAKDLLQATETPNKVKDGTAFHTSHISGVVSLLKGDEIYVKVSNLSLVHLVGNARTIFTGLFRLPTSRTDPGF